MLETLQWPFGFEQHPIWVPEIPPNPEPGCRKESLMAGGLSPRCWGKGAVLAKLRFRLRL